MRFHNAAKAHAGGDEAPVPARATALREALPRRAEAVRASLAALEDAQRQAEARSAARAEELREAQAALEVRCDEEKLRTQAVATADDLNSKFAADGSGKAELTFGSNEVFESGLVGFIGQPLMRTESNALQEISTTIRGKPPAGVSKRPGYRSSDTGCYGKDGKYTANRR